MTAAALDSSQIGKIGVGIIIALVVVGLLLSFFITALIGRLIILVLVVVLGGAVWQQRQHIEDNINKHKCNLSASFFGFSVKAPSDVVRACQQNLK